jgi:hypothetical protein
VRDLTVREAAPSPPQGVIRDGLVTISEARAEAAESAITAALNGYLTRVGGVVRSRMSGPKARRGTKWWRLPDLEPDGAPVEVKAVDAAQVAPDKLIHEVRDALRPVALRIAQQAAADTATRLGAKPGNRDSVLALDSDGLATIVDEIVGEILRVADHHVRDVRQAITAADADAGTLDEVLDRVDAAHRRGSNWVLMSGRTLANALVNESSILQARALGVTHAQWLSRRDRRVRATHRAADGQVRALSDRYRVGAFRLRHPGDPADLPASWPEVANCRCSLLLAPPDDAARAALRELAKIGSRTVSPGARRLLAEAARKPATGRPLGAPPGIAHAVRTTEPVVAFRSLTGGIVAVAGQWLVLPSGVALALAAPAVFDASVLSVVIPVGTPLIVVGGAVMLADGTPLEVVASGGGGVQVRALSGEPAT